MKSDFIINDQIRATVVQLIDENGNQLGTININEAKNIARNKGLDILQVNSNNPPLCKLINYEKWRYQQDKKEKEIKRTNKKNQIETKELWLRPTTGWNDVLIKIKKAQDFLDKKHRVKLGVEFKGRENSHQEIGRDLLQKMLKELTNYHIMKHIASGQNEVTVTIEFSKESETHDKN